MSEPENFSFLVRGELAAMAYPNAPGTLKHLWEHGFRSVISVSRRAPSLGALGAFVHLHCPLADFTRIPSEDLHRVVAFLEHAPKPAIVHGEGGIGRTGVALACRLVALGRSATEAVTEVRRARPGSIDDRELEASVEDYERFYHATYGSTAKSPFNFAPASPLDRIVYGAEQPDLGVPRASASGVRTLVSRDVVGAAPLTPGEAPIGSWLGFMARQGVREVLCLLDDGELALYRSPLLRRYQREFLRMSHVPIEVGALPSPGAIGQALDALRRAEEGGTQVVVHCSSGIGLTGIVLAAWLRARHGLAPDAAAALVREHASHFGAARDPLELGTEVLPLLEGVPLQR